MSQALSMVFVHVIFSTKNRDPWLTPETRMKLFPYMASVLNNLDCDALEVGGVDDHVHILCRQHKGITIQDLIKEIKTTSSRWVKEQGKEFRGFYWQGGYGAFSVSPNLLSRVRNYILNQEAHHKNTTFQDEFRRFLKEYRMEYDERYVWD